MRRALALLVAALALLPAAATASHMQFYTRSTEHDDIGRSDEPDYASTAVLGLPLENRVIDLSLVDGASAVPDSAFVAARPLAPGCTGDAGRQPSGLCYLNLAVRFLGEPGMSGSAAPGFTGSKAIPVRFLDMRQDAQFTVPVTRVVDLNHKLQDNGVSAALSGVDSSLGSRFVAGPTSVWAWFGQWRDKNGNGVIDHEQDPGEPGTVSERNEFVWLGGCLDTAAAPTGDTVFCHPLPRSQMAGWVWPGNHHPGCGGGTVAGVDPVIGCAYVAADMPGLQVYCLVALGVLEQFPHAIADLLVEGASVHGCGSGPESLDQDAAHLYGDPLLEDPTPVAPDFFFVDRSGDPDVEARQWVAGQGYPMWFYDQSLLGNTVFVAAEGAPLQDSRRLLDLQRARFLDVDAYHAWNPAAAELLQGQVKPIARIQWLTYREQVVASFNTGSAVARGQALDTSPVVGPTYASLLDPGYAHEPNDPRDAYPGATHGAFGPADHDGLNHSYEGYQAAPRGWLDAQPVRLMTDNTAWQLPEPSGDYLSQCITCVAGPGLTNSASVLSGPRAAGDDRRGLDPGLWTWVGYVGLWWDKPQRWLEESLQLPELRFLFQFQTAPPDGWVGNVVNATGAYHYRGYTAQDCAVHGAPGPHEHAWCHPTMHGQLGDGNDYLNALTEFRGQCTSNQAVTTVNLAPDGGAWTVPVFVLRAFDTQLPDPARVEDWTGRADNPLTPGNEAELKLRLACEDVLLGSFHASDLLVLPAGNFQLALTATARAEVLRLDEGRDVVVDVDALAAWG